MIGASLNQYQITATDGLWVRRLDQLLPPVLISAAEKVSSPFWSPQSTDVAWFEDASLKRAPVTGGPDGCRAGIMPVAATGGHYPA